MPEEVDQNLGKRNAINTPELFQQTLVLIASKVRKFFNSFGKSDQKWGQ